MQTGTIPQGRRSTQNELYACLAASFLFGFLCHGYRYLSSAFSGDAALISQAGEEAYQVSLGRFLQPVWWRVRGLVTAPFLIGLFSLVFLAMSAWTAARILRLNGKRPLILISGLFTASETIGIANATYLPWSDVYCLALFLSLLGAHFSLRATGRKKWLSIAFYAASLALYQSYLTCAAAIIVIALIQDLCTERQKTNGIWRSGAIAVLHLFLGLALYAIVLRILLSVLGVSASQDYNGVGRVGPVSPGELLRLLWEAWLAPLRFLLNPADREMIPWHHSRIPQALNLAALIIAVFLFFAGRKHDPASLRTGFFLFAMLPIAENFVMVISQGVINGLMIYAWSFLYLLPVALAWTPGPHVRCFRVARAACALCLSLLFLRNAVTCNAISLKRDAEYTATHAALTRVLNRMEETDGYQPGMTPVVVVGMLPSSPISMMRPGMQAVSTLQGMRYTYGASYETSGYWYLRMILGANVRLVSHEERAQLTRRTPGISEMPAFPASGSVRMMDGRLFVRLN